MLSKTVKIKKFILLNKLKADLRMSPKREREPFKYANFRVNK
jgi:hypothetical protein